MFIAPLYGVGYIWYALFDIGSYRSLFCRNRMLPFLAGFTACECANNLLLIFLDRFTKCSLVENIISCLTYLPLYNMVIGGTTVILHYSCCDGFLYGLYILLF